MLWSNQTHKRTPWLLRQATPKTLSIKNRYYVREVRESLEIDMVLVRYGQDKMLNRDNGNFVKTIAWKTLFRKMKALHWNLTSFCTKWWFYVVIWSVWKIFQLEWPKYHVVNNITCVVLLADSCLIFHRLTYFVLLTMLENTERVTTAKNSHVSGINFFN